MSAQGGETVQYNYYLYKAHLIQHILSDIEVSIDQRIIDEKEFNAMLVDRKNLSCYNVEKVRQGGIFNEPK